MTRRTVSLFVCSFIATLVLGGLTPTLAQAQDGEFVDSELDQPGEDIREGFAGDLSIGASANLTSNRDVVGENDGFSALLGLRIDGTLGFIDGDHVWSNTLRVDESWSRNPTLSRLIKSNDSAELESLYTYFWRDWFGPFGRGSVKTSLFDTHRVTEEPTDYIVEDLDGDLEILEARESVLLSPANQPLTLQQSLGVFAQPVTEEKITWTNRAGLGGRQTFARGVLAVDDQDDTEEIDLVELDHVFQGGLEAFSGISGEIEESDLSYRAGANALLPLVNNDDTADSPLELTRWGVSAGVTLDVNAWIDLNYDVEVLRDPQLIDATQVQNNVLVTFGHTLIERDRVPEPTDAEKAEALREEAAELEDEAAELEGEDEGDADEDADDEN
ncbi:MAG: hypothetical protein ACOCV2_12540 [Persicimonas sp.]